MSYSIEDNGQIYVRPTMGRPDVYITTKWIEDHKEQYGNLYIDKKPLVRCKDCKYWTDGTCEMLGTVHMTADDFCSKGEDR